MTMPRALPSRRDAIGEISTLFAICAGYTLLPDTSHRETLLEKIYDPCLPARIFLLEDYFVCILIVEEDGSFW